MDERRRYDPRQRVRQRACCSRLSGPALSGRLSIQFVPANDERRVVARLFGCDDACGRRLVCARPSLLIYIAVSDWTMQWTIV